MPTQVEMVRSYEKLIQSRTREKTPPSLIPADHVVNWDDAPSKYTTYRDSARVPLCAGVLHERLEFFRQTAVVPRSHPTAMTVETLSEFLRLTAGVRRRRLDLSWNHPGAELADYRRTTFSRGTASGGGLYPVELYLSPRANGTLPQGIYHYANAHHALTRIRMGEYESAIASATRYEGIESGDLTIVLTVRFWKNCFKYYNFCYQVINQDIGATLGTMLQIAQALNWNANVVYWFDDLSVSSLLGLDHADEVPLAVLVINRDRPKGDSRNGESPHRTKEPAPFLTKIHKRIFERSKKRFFPGLLADVHRQTLLDDITCPDGSPLLEENLNDLSSNAEMKPAPREISGDLASILGNRKTTWGRFRKEPGLDLAPLQRILVCLDNGSAYKADVYGEDVRLPTLRVSLISQNVQGLQPGVYDYRAASQTLVQKSDAGTVTSLQGTYFLSNYNLDQIAAVLVVIGKQELVLETFGARGIRVMNAEVGIAAQRVYMASEALSIGCGAALGFDAHEISRITGVDLEVEAPLLLIFLGNEVKSAHAYDFRLD